MKRLLCLALLALPAPALAQMQDMPGMEGMDHSMHRQPATNPPPAHDHTAPAPMDHATHGQAAPPVPPPPPHDHGAQTASPAPITAPPIPTDHAADALYDPAAMARARAALARENGGMVQSMILIDMLETQVRKGADGYRWEGEAWFGGDIDRLTIKTEGEGVYRSALNSAEVQALWSHAIDPWFNLQAGARQDLRPTPARTYASLGIEGLAPYWFKLTGTAFLSDKGDLTARLEASHDIRLTQRLLLTPRLEANLSAQDVPAQGVGSGLSEIELGARLHYAFVPRFAPYVGVEWRRALGDTARYERLAGEDADSVGFVIGVRFWF
jgi:copper resistance protein B